MKCSECDRYHSGIAVYPTAETGTPLVCIRSIQKLCVSPFGFDDFTSAYSEAHYAKGAKYVKHLKKQYKGYRVEYEESYWADSTMTVEATAKNGVKYFPGNSKP